MKEGTIHLSNIPVLKKKTTGINGGMNDPAIALLTLKNKWKSAVFCGIMICMKDKVVN
ncbi:MAG: hypothetical protein ACO1OO_01690 [Flavisolibacter sp.]